VHADVDETASLERAMVGVDTLVYLVHHMRSGHADLLASERAAAQRVLAVAEAAGVGRIVYLGGPEPEGELSAHLQARLVTGEVLRSGSVSTLELRAGMVIGAESESWLMVRDLAFRLPVMVLPAWLNSSSQPIGIDDVVDALTHAVAHDIEGSHAFDLPGPETLTAREILERVTRLLGLTPRMISMPMLPPSISAHWLRFVTRADFSVAQKLVKGLKSDCVAQGPSYWTEMGRTPMRFDQAVRLALAAEDPAQSGRVARRWERLRLMLRRSRQAPNPA
jgi:uncharacterized protein YbjT (DUF2867 family)